MPDTGADPAVSTVLDAALAYSRLGWSVVPIAPHEKRPLVPWTDFQHRTASEAEIRAWFTRWPDANVGIVTGAVSGLVVIDIDPHHGGVESIRRVERDHGALPRTVEVETGGGGRHLYFRHPGRPVANRVGLAPGIDLRADGGLVVAPPSRHPSGRPYRFVQGQDPGATPAAPLPEWFLEWFLATAGAAGHGHAVAYWRNLVKTGMREGNRNNTIASLTGHLLWHGVDPQVVTELLLCWNAVRAEPPLPTDEVVRTVESIRRVQAHHERPEVARDRS